MHALLRRGLTTLAALGFLAGCGVHARSAARYSGDVEGALVHPAGIQELPALPPGYYEIGSVDARCTQVNEREISRAWLSDVDCTEERLTLALKEQAADVGGNMLVGKQCYSLEESSGKRIVCRAAVGRPEAETPPPEFTYLDEPDPRASQAWSIRVQYTPASDEVRPPRTPQNVTEALNKPVSHILLGSVVTGCEIGCTEAGARAGLFAVAGRMGANSITN
ncbi:MAG: hypothetical protein KC492_32320, partial [Myxococcales bacterium]|nr:hypothetical protein [Myxococcales bacterium]